MLLAANSIYSPHFAIWPAKRSVLERPVCHLAACSDNNDCLCEVFKGGVFGLCDDKMVSLMTSLQSTETAKQVLYWGDISDPLPC